MAALRSPVITVCTVAATLALRLLDPALEQLRHVLGGYREYGVDALGMSRGALREQFMDLVSALVSGDPAAHAEAWLEEALANAMQAAVMASNASLR